MKHSKKITGILLGLFLLAQFIGILIIHNYVDRGLTDQTGEVTFKELPIGERPEVEEGTSYIPILIAVVLGTILLLFLMKHKLHWVWKGWFFLAVLISLVVAFNAFIPALYASILAVILAALKLWRPRFLTQTITELFMYGGLAAIFVPMFNMWSISILLVLIAIYDAYAVWKSKHMITLAKSQADAKMFAGLLIPYAVPKKVKKPSKKLKKKLKTVPVKVRTAMLGGGDIAFPLLFAGVILKEFGLWQSLVIPFFAMGGLAFLLFRSEQKKFYPAMPFIGVGCFIGLGVVWLLQILL